MAILCVQYASVAWAIPCWCRLWEVQLIYTVTERCVYPKVLSCVFGSNDSSVYVWSLLGFDSLNVNRIDHTTWISYSQRCSSVLVYRYIKDNGFSIAFAVIANANRTAKCSSEKVMSVIPCCWQFYLYFCFYLVQFNSYLYYAKSLAWSDLFMPWESSASKFEGGRLLSTPAGFVKQPGQWVFVGILLSFVLQPLNARLYLTPDLTHKHIPHGHFWAQQISWFSVLSQSSLSAYLMYHKLLTICTLIHNHLQKWLL